MKSLRSHSVKLGLQWRMEDVGDARTVIYLPVRAAHRIWNQSKRKKCIVGSKAETEDSPKPLTQI